MASSCVPSGVIPMYRTLRTRLVASASVRMPFPSVVEFMKRTRMPSSSNIVAISAVFATIMFRSLTRSPISSAIMDPESSTNSTIS